MKYKRKILNRINDYVRANYTKINPEEFVLGELIYNFRCHLNSVQKVKEGKCSKVFLCITIDTENDSPIVHFINGIEDGKYMDNTLGWVKQEFEYYIVKEVHENEYDKIWNLLMTTKRHLVNNNSNEFLNFIFRINENII